MGDGSSNGGALRRERVALVHDFLLDLRGAERVFLAMCEIWPDADVYTAVYDEEGTEGRFAHRNVQATFLQRLNPTANTFRALLPFYPAAIESLDLSGYDLIVSSSSAWSQGVIPGPNTVHVCYSHNPFRYAWNDRDRTLAERRDPVSRAILRRLFHRWRQWDWIAAQRVDHYVANSRVTQGRIRSYYGRESSIVHPPVETVALRPGPHRGLPPRPVRADAAQADRHGRRGLQPARPAARDRGRRARHAPPAPDGRADRHLRGPGVRRARRAPARGLPRARRHRGRGVRHRRRRGPGRRAGRSSPSPPAARSRRSSTA